MHHVVVFYSFRSEKTPTRQQFRISRTRGKNRQKKKNYCIDTLDIGRTHYKYVTCLRLYTTPLLPIKSVSYGFYPLTVVIVVGRFVVVRGRIITYFPSTSCDARRFL